VLLAAGASTRFGTNKLLHPLKNGVTIAETTAHQLRLAVPASVAVIRPGNLALRTRLERLGMRVVECTRAERGLGTSIACGVSACAHADGWLIVLADMPWILPSTFHAVAQSLAQGAPLVVPHYRGEQGHPVGFSAEFRESLRALDGEHGARSIIESAADRGQRMSIDDAGIVRDIDIPAHLHNVRALDSISIQRSIVS
jgi:molybdenum cofactor cytidylyltransferase